jgi:hypothetical protein
MTVHQENVGTKTDYGEIGFVEGVQGSFLIFPKSLKRYEGKRVVGVKYDLLKEPPLMEAAPKKKPAKPKAAPKPEPEPEPVKPPPQPAPKFEPLRVFKPEEPKPVKAKPAAEPDQREHFNALTREVRKALKKLEQGNSVAAYQILEKALAAK